MISNGKYGLHKENRPGCAEDARVAKTPVSKVEKINLETLA
ncbi:hypothetical protein RBIBE_11650 [Bacillus velezensis]|nr:hypothetical protein RBIBE_11650 [Bacillus velezensis]